MKKSAIWALALVATLALTGCSGLLGSDSQESVQPSPSFSTEASVSATASAQTSPSPTPESSATSQAAAETTSDSGFGSASESSSDSAFDSDMGSTHSASADQLSADDLLEVAQALESYYEQGGVQIIENADLKSAAEQSEELIASMDVSPAKCGVYATSGTMDMISHMNMVSVSVPSGSNDAGMAVSIGSFDDASDVDKAVSMGKSSARDCNEFTMTMGGQDITAAVETGQANTNAQDTIATVTEVGLAGQKTQTLTVNGYDGVNTIGVTIISPKDVDVAVAQAEEYLDLALLHMAGY
jgi:hypothetical protein